MLCCYRTHFTAAAARADVIHIDLTLQFIRFTTAACAFLPGTCLLPRTGFKHHRVGWFPLPFLLPLGTCLPVTYHLYHRNRVYSCRSPAVHARMPFPLRARTKPAHPRILPPTPPPPVSRRCLAVTCRRFVAFTDSAFTIYARDWIPGFCWFRFSAAVTTLRFATPRLRFA